MKFTVVSDARRIDPRPSEPSPLEQALRKGDTVLIEATSKNTRNRIYSVTKRIRKDGFAVHTHAAVDGIVVWADPPGVG